MAGKKVALGRGLKALIPETTTARAGLVELPVDRIRPNPEQPRHRFDEQALRELAASIAEHGLLQPLLVSEDGEAGYRLIAGERRWRAARLAGLTHLPAVVRERVSGDGEFELALVENLQRRDLTPLEEARAFDHLRSRLGLSQAQIAARVGIDRSTVANALRLLKLPPEVQDLVEEGELSAGHARALLAFDDDQVRHQWAQRIRETGASVREVERAAADARTPAPTTRPRRSGAGTAKDPNLDAAEEKLSLHLGTRVQIESGARGGRIVIRCSDRAELMRVFDRLMGGDHGSGK